MTYNYGIVFTALLAMSGIACTSRNAIRVESIGDTDRQVQQLLGAAESGDRDSLQKLLAQGVDIDAIEGGGGGTALYQAVLLSDVNAVKLLLECGADTNKSAEYGVIYGDTPLHAATLSNSDDDVKIVKLLLSYGANVNTKGVSHIHQGRGTGFSGGYTPLLNAAGVIPVNESEEEDSEYISNIEVVKLLLAHGADANAIDAKGCTALYRALGSSSLDIMELLLKHGTDVNLRNKEDGGTILHEAAYFGWPEEVQFLIAHGANVHSRDFDGETPLHRAALGRRMDVVSVLVNNGADIHAISKRNETPQTFLDEPNDTEPIFLSDKDKHPFALVVTDGLNIRRKLKFESIDYDTIWIPSSKDIEGLQCALKKWISEGEYEDDNGYIQNYILDHFFQYNCEYAGFMINGNKHIFCNMSQMATEDNSTQLPKNDFSDGMVGCSQIILIFDAQTKEVLRLRCKGMSYIGESEQRAAIDAAARRD